MRKMTAWSVGCIALQIAGCTADTPPNERRARPDQIPASIHVPGGQVMLGFALGKTRSPADVSAFDMTKTPITVRQYRECVEAGACSAPNWATTSCALGDGAADGPTYLRGVDEVPVTCASPAQAKRYCAWLGGRLPNAAEWFAAARGKNPTRFAWGNEPPTCDQQWRLAWEAKGQSCCAGDCAAPGAATVGAHAKGTSGAGISDVLSTRAELVGAGGPDFGLCSKYGCMITGLVPGAADSFVPLDSELDQGIDRAEVLDESSRSAPVSSFRCVFPRSAT